MILNRAERWSILWISNFNNLPYTLGWVGDGLGVPTQAYWARGDCHTFFSKMLNQKAVIKRFSFVFHMNARANTYQKNHISLRVYFSWVRSSTQLVWRKVLLNLLLVLSTCVWFYKLAFGSSLLAFGFTQLALGSRLLAFGFIQLG